MIEVKEVLYQWQRGTSKIGIARSLGMSRNTVKRMIKQARLLGLGQEEEAVVLARLQAKYAKRGRGAGEAQALIASQHGQIVEWLAMPDMTVRQMVRLFKKQDQQISESSLRRYLRAANLSSSTKPTVHLEMTPGEQAQVDFGYVGYMWDPATQRKRKTYAFVMLLAYSRYRFVRFVFQQDMQSWIDCHIRAFAFFKGVPKTILLDNLKAGVIQADIYDPTLNRSYAELERFYGFVADPAKVRKPQHKGRVERSIPVVRQQLIAGCPYTDIHQANTRALQWCREEIAQVVTRTTGQTPAALFVEQEQQALLSLPAQAFEGASWQPAKVHRDHHIVFERAFYSLPTRYIGEQVWVRGSLKTVQIYYQEQLIKTHLRADCGQWMTDKADYPESARLFLEKDRNACLQEAKLIGEHAYRLLEGLLDKDPPSRACQRKSQAILRLANTYGKAQLEAGCKRALSFGNQSYKSLKRMLKLKLVQPEETSAIVLSSQSAYLRGIEEFNAGRISA